MIALALLTVAACCHATWNRGVGLGLGVAACSCAYTLWDGIAITVLDVDLLSYLAVSNLAQVILLTAVVRHPLDHHRTRRHRRRRAARSLAVRWLARTLDFTVG